MGSDAADASLWRRALDGDQRAFAEVFDRRHRAVYNFLFRRVGDWSVAEDLTSVVFLEAWRRRRHVVFVDDSALPWLLGTATNVLRNHRRSLRRHQAALARVPVDRPHDHVADDVAARLDDERRMRAVVAALDTLGRADREVLGCAWAGLSYEETAVALGVPVGTVRSRLSRARARLAKVLGPGLEPAAASGHEQDVRHLALRPTGSV